MYKNIIPNLISFDTDLVKINGFYFSDNFEFYSQISYKNKFHYKVCVDDRIIIPKEYEYKDGYFLRSGDKFFYERKIEGFTLKFCFDPLNKKFSFNKMYSLIPFELGHIFSVGRHVADFINLDLFINGFNSIRGCAFEHEKENICVIGPSMNGKTSLVKKIVEKGGKYISDDILVIDFFNNRVYPVSCIKNYGRSSNKELERLLRNRRYVLNPVVIDKILLMQNTTIDNPTIINKNIFDFFNLNSFLFLKNHLARSYIFESNLASMVFSKINELMKLEINYEFKLVNNYNSYALINAL